jgi:hypothetical protein
MYTTCVCYVFVLWKFVLWSSNEEILFENLVYTLNMPLILVLIFLKLLVFIGIVIVEDLSEWRCLSPYQTNSVALGPRANYTNWSTAMCGRNLVPTFVDRGVSRGQRGGSPTFITLSDLTIL